MTTWVSSWRYTLQLIRGTECAKRRGLPYEGVADILRAMLSSPAVHTRPAVELGTARSVVVSYGMPASYKID